MLARNDLSATLARKDFFVRYRRATFGVLWAVALPAVQAIVLAVVLTRVARISLPHYKAFIFSGVVAWTYFSMVLTLGSKSIVENSQLSSRVYFPRVILPLATCLSNVYPLVISSLIAVLAAWLTGVSPGLHTLLLPVALLVVFVFTTSLTLVLAATQVYFRDTQYFVQAALLAWFYGTPIFYPMSRLHSETMRRIVIGNPVTGVVELFHAAVVHMPIETSTWLVTLGWTVGLLFIAGALYSRHDRAFADLL